jgi:hypothetical protein
MRTGRGNRGTQRKPAPVLLCPSRNPCDLAWGRTGPATKSLSYLYDTTKRQQFSLLHSVQTGSGVHPMGTWGSCSGLKLPGCEADHSASSVEAKNGGAIPPLQIYLHCVVRNYMIK